MANLLRFCRTNSSRRVLDAHAEMARPEGLRKTNDEVDLSAAFRTNDGGVPALGPLRVEKGTYDTAAARSATRRPRVVRSLRPTGGDEAWCEWTCAASYG